MISAKSLFEEIHANDGAYCLLMSAAAQGEFQGGWENRRIAELTEDLTLRAKIRRHGDDEAKHGRLFQSLLDRRRLTPIELPIEADYCRLLEQRGIGLSHERLRRDEMLSPQEHLAYLAHSRVTEQRAAEEVAQLVDVFGHDEFLGPALRMIADDEVNHLSFCHEELSNLMRRAPDLPIESTLRHYAREESKVYLHVAIDFIERVGELLGWGLAKRSLLRTGAHALHTAEKLFTWRRFSRIGTPERPGALSPDGEVALENETAHDPM